jgi:hypothetical protein
MGLNKRELIIDSIKHMNIDALQDLLNDKYTYQDVKKEVFVLKLKNIFEAQKMLGDTLLIPYKGLCYSETCENQGCGGVSFIGDITHEHLDLIMLEEGDDFKDIFFCAQFGTDQEQIEKGDRLFIDFETDEKADFNADINYLVCKQKCEEALLEIEKSGLKLNLEDINYWLTKYQETFEKIEPNFNYSAFNRFGEIYENLKYLAEMTEKEYDINLAIEKLNLINIEDDDEMTKWYCEHEELRDIFYNEFLGDNNTAQKDSDYLEYKNIKVSTKDFENYIKIKNLFFPHYFKIWEKYNNCTEEEIEKLTDEIGLIDQEYYKISYHLKRLGLIN